MNFFQRVMPVVVLVAAVLFVVVTIVSFAYEKAYFNHFVPEREATIGRHFIELLHAKNYAEIESSLDASIKGPDTREELVQAASALPTSIDHVDVVGYHWSKTTTDPGTTYDFAYEVSGAGAWSVVGVDFNEDGLALALTSLRTQPLTDSLEHTNAFTFADKGANQYAFLFLVFALGAFVAVTFVICYRSPEVTNRWAWMLFIAVGVVQASMNWTTGQTYIQPITFHAPPAFIADSGPNTPWILGFNIPIGAIIFWLRRKTIAAPKPTRIEPFPALEITPT